MQKLYSQTIGQFIVRKHDGEEIAVIEDLVIDTDTGKIQGLWLKPFVFFAKSLILLWRDIQVWQIKLYIENEEVLAEPEDLIRLKPIFDKDIQIYHNQVITNENVYLGKVYDFNFDVDSGQIINLFIVKKFLFVPIERRILPLKEVIEIRSDAIVVKSDLRLSKWRKKNLVDLKNFVFTPDPEPMISKKN